MKRWLWASGGALAFFLITACEQDLSSLPARDHSGDAAAGAAYAAAGADAPDPRDAPVPKVAGRPLWSANRSSTAEENARSHFERNGEAFGAKSMDEYVAMAHAFTGDPPRGAQTLKRQSNGDTLIYDPATNVFAVVTREGAPRTMFKPDDGAAYWERQKQQEGT